MRLVRRMLSFASFQNPPPIAAVQEDVREKVLRLTRTISLTLRRRSGFLRNERQKYDSSLLTPKVCTEMKTHLQLLMYAILKDEQRDEGAIESYRLVVHNHENLIRSFALVAPIESDVSSHDYADNDITFVFGNPATKNETIDADRMFNILVDLNSCWNRLHTICTLKQRQGGR